MRNVNTERQRPQPDQHGARREGRACAPARRSSEPRLVTIESDDVRQHRHLQQLDEPVGGPREHRRALAKEQADGRAGGEPDQNPL